MLQKSGLKMCDIMLLFVILNSKTLNNKQVLTEVEEPKATQQFI